MKKIAIINGPNLNLLGEREKHIYGEDTLEDVERNLQKICQNKEGVSLVFFQSNHEGEIIDFIHSLKKKKYHSLIANLGAFTHTSIAIRDALIVVAIPFIEVHISNIYQREDFRHHSYVSNIAKGSIIGLGTKGYELALRYLADF